MLIPGQGIFFNTWSPTSNVSLAAIAKPIKVMTGVGVVAAATAKILEPFVKPVIEETIVKPALNGLSEGLYDEIQGLRNATMQTRQQQQRN